MLIEETHSQTLMIGPLSSSEDSHRLFPFLYLSLTHTNYVYTGIVNKRLATRSSNVTREMVSSQVITKMHDAIVIREPYQEKTGAFSRAF